MDRARLTRRKLLGSTVVIAVAAPAHAASARTTLRERESQIAITTDGTFVNQVYDTTITWKAPWEKGVVFGGDPPGNKSPILNNSENDDFVMFTTTDPTLDFADIDAYLDKVEEDYSTMFFVPFRDGAEQLILLLQERTKKGYAMLCAYQAPAGPAFDLYDYQYDTSTKLVNVTQLSAFATAFAETFTSLQEDVTVNDEPPFSTLEDDDILDAAAEA